MIKIFFKIKNFFINFNNKFIFNFKKMKRDNKRIEMHYQN